jgi:hypothetical protein
MSEICVHVHVCICAILMTVFTFLLYLNHSVLSHESQQLCNNKLHGISYNKTSESGDTVCPSTILILFTHVHV